MIEFLKKNLKTGFYIGLALIVLFVAKWAYGVWTDYQTLQHEHQMSLQNQQALSDSLNVLASRETVIASKIEDLALKKDTLQHKNTILEIKTKLLLDSLKKQGKANNTLATDSTVKVTFSSKELFVNFNGWTLANLRDTSLSTWGLEMKFDDIDTRADLFQDPIDKLWKLHTISLMPGVQLKGISTLDEKTYDMLQKYKAPQPPKSLGLNLQFNTKDCWGGIILRYNEQWYLNANYRVVNALPRWTDNLLLGISYFLF